MKRKLSQKQLDALAYGRRGGYWKHTEATKKLFSEQKKKNNPMKGKFGKKHHNWSRIKIYCDNCGKAKEIAKCFLKIYKNHFCNMKCKREYDSNHRKTYPYYYYGKDWPKVREKILKRDDYKCKKCNSTQLLEVHHKHRWLDSRNNDENNLITLCRKCHSKTKKMCN